MGLPEALILAERGLRVFPLAKNSKKPVFRNWQEQASSDVSRVVEMFTSVRSRDGQQYPADQDMEYNVGILTDGMLVVDVDVKNGKNGWQSFLSHEPDLNTLTVETPSGGRHYYYDTLGTSWSNSAGNRLGEGVDTRSYHGYVVAPGATVDGKEYRVIHDVPLAPVPPSIISKMVIPRVRQEARGVFEGQDSASCVEYAKDLARRSSAAFAGEQSQRAYELACRMRDHGVSDLMATAIMAEDWGPRCEPPLDYDDIEPRVQNAYQYAKGIAGELSAAYVFSEFAGEGNTFDTQKKSAPSEGTLDADAQTTENKQDNNHAVKDEHDTDEQKGGFTFGNMTPREKLTPRPWIVKDLLLSGDVTTMAAEGSAGKTTFLLNVAVHLAAGASDILGYKNTLEGCPVKSIIHSAEDDIVELSRRIEGICIEHGYEAACIAPYIALSSGKDRDLRFAVTDQAGNPVAGKEALSQIVSLVNTGNVGLIGLDPLANLHTLNENDSVQMTFLMSVFNQLAKNTGAAVLLMHHTHKTADGGVSSSRGSSAIMNSSRIGMVLNRVTEKDAAEHGIPAKDIPRVTWLGEGKSNVSERKGLRRWYIMKSVKLWTEDTVGVPTRYDVRVARDNSDTRIASKIKDYVMGNNKSGVSVREATNYLRNVEAEDMFIKCAAAEAENLLKQVLRRSSNLVEVTAENKIVLAGLQGGIVGSNVVAFYQGMKPII